MYINEKQHSQAPVKHLRHLSYIYIYRADNSGSINTFLDQAPKVLLVGFEVLRVVIMMCSIV
jgi:hypothetical protein